MFFIRATGKIRDKNANQNYETYTFREILFQYENRGRKNLICVSSNFSIKLDQIDKKAHEITRYFHLHLSSPFKEWNCESSRSS